MVEALFLAPPTPQTFQMFCNDGRIPKREFFLPFRSTPSLFLSSPLSSHSSLLLSIRDIPLFCFYSHATSTSTRSSNEKFPVVSDGKENQNHQICSGCGVFMQNSNPNLPGFYQKRVDATLHVEDGSDDLPSYSDELLEEEEEEEEEDDDEDFEGFPKCDIGSEIDGPSDEISLVELGDDDRGIDWDSDWDLKEDELSKWKKELNGFTLPGVGYGNITETTLKKVRKEKISKSEKKRKLRKAMRNETDCSDTVCTRCHSLRNYGQVKNQRAEDLLPALDLDHFISTKLIKSSTSAPVVVIVVDCVDFDGSFPKQASKFLFKALEMSKNSSKVTKLPKLVLVATKVDLLPQQISPVRLDRWVRRRAKAAGAPKLTAVYLVSARKDLGVRNLLYFIKELAGPRGNVWVIGTQNAGKSTLINTFAKKEGAKVSRLTEAAVPGTTLGILRIAGILPAKAKMYDTPGLLNPCLMTMRLNREEQKMAEIRKELQPRTYRVKVGQTVHIGGLVRLDLTQCSVDTIYVTVWASPYVSLHLGKIDNAEELRGKHFGIRLQPPIGQDRATELGEWNAREFKVSGSSWEVNSVDLAVSGLGWFSLGLRCEATVVLWTFNGIDVVEREPLVLDRAPFLERPGFLLPKAVSDAIRNQVNMEAEAWKKKVEEDLYLEASL